MMARFRLTTLLVILGVPTDFLSAAAPPTLTGIDQHGDPLPRGAIARLGTERLRLGMRSMDGMAQVIFSPDGRTLLSRGKTGFRLWDATSGRALPWMLPAAQSQAATLLPDGKTLVRATWEKIHDERYICQWRIDRWLWGTE